MEHPKRGDNIENWPRVQQVEKRDLSLRLPQQFFPNFVFPIR
ncbi:MAG: hypothetical protein HW380_1162 [Magnetococcales bacterium]|nr:hypothetical protein [Magnetococcales bacterium]